MNDCELLKYLIYDFFYYFILLEILTLEILMTLINSSRILRST